MPIPRRLLALTVTLLMLPGTAAAITTYDIHVDGDTADINITMELYVDDTERTTRYTFDNRFLPSGMTVDSVEDSDGAVEYTAQGENIRFETEIPAGQEKEVVTIQGSIEDVVTESFREVDLVRLQLSGFQDRNPDVPDEVTQVQLRTRRQLLAGSHSFRFDSSFSPHGANYSGNGPVNLQLSISDAGEGYDNLVLFGPGDLSTSDDLYWVAVAVTGFHPQVNRFPVIVYEDDTYDEVVDEWSAGQYRSGGLIFVRESTLEDDQGPAVVLHEIMHGFNDHALNWYAGERAWFDEGTAKYVEWLVNERREVPQAEIFGQEVSWSCGEFRRCSYPPRGTPDQLWNFYQRDEPFLATWSPLQSPDTETRRFGYALSELVFREYVMSNGEESLPQAYNDILSLNEELDRQVGGEEANTRLRQIMGTDFRPCDSPDRGEFDQCLRNVNGMDAEIPELGDVDRDVKKVAIQPIERPQPQNSSIYDRIQNRVVRETSDSSAFVQFFDGFLQWVLQVLGLA